MLASRFRRRPVGWQCAACNEADDCFTLARRRFHHLTFYGFMLCFASTSVATFYHCALGLKAPYAMTNLPVVRGTFGGIGLIIGPVGLVLLVLRHAAAMPALLAVHMGIVMALLLTMPQGKFAHAVYRAAALLQYAIDKRLPNRLGVGGD